jgi:RNA polymerase sigma factor (sigma-70 family)
VNGPTDSQLLRAYAEHRSEPAFAELVSRHVDFVYSAARRMVCDSHLAEDVTQGVFIALAKAATQLTDRQVLSGWLHRTAQNIAAQTVRTDVRRRAREQEAVAMNELLAAEPAAAWEHIAPHLDAALGELSEPDRDAVLLRYFDHKSAREMAETLGTSEDAAQKRLNRAVERLREFFAKRGVTVGASGLVVAISASAVQAAPVGLAVTISTAAALAGTAVSTSTAIAATKTIAMTTFQKSLVVAALAAAVGAGIYEARRASQSQREVVALQQQQAPLAEQVDRLRQQRDDAVRKLQSAQQHIEQVGRDTAELPKLRSEVARLREQSRELTQLKSAARGTNDPFTQSVLSMANRAAELNSRLQQMPEKKIPELQLLTENDWLAAAKDSDLDTDAGVRTALRDLRRIAKNEFGKMIGNALAKYVEANNGQLPADVAELLPHLKQPIDPAILQRYQMLYSGQLSDVPPAPGGHGQWVISEKAPVDSDYDSHLYIGPGRTSSFATGRNESGDPDSSWATRP